MGEDGEEVGQVQEQSVGGGLWVQVSSTLEPN